MRFIGSDSGYALVLTLLFMPVFVGMSLLVIDISRGNNAQSDLQAAADALALAGARELDAGVDSIDRALVAMAQVNNTVSFLGRTDEASATTLAFSDENRGAFTVVFLSSLPANDDTPLTQAFLTANAVTNDPADDQRDARFVYVRAQSRDLSPFFALFFEGVNQVTDVPVAAQAVATFRRTACDITPIYMCNPFELNPSTDLPTAFSTGLLHARLIDLQPSTLNQDTAPGNFGFLRVNGQGANVLGEALGSGVNPTCYESTGVSTEPGANASIISDFNQRFDIYPNGGGGFRYPPALNVRKGYVVPLPTSPGQLNNIATNDADFCTDAILDPANVLLASPYQQSANPEDIAGGLLGRAGVDWPLFGAGGYWAVNHPTRTPIEDLPFDEFSSYRFFDTPDPAAIQIPSRYDIYRYEIEADLLDDVSIGASSLNPTYLSEVGRPQCFGPSYAPVAEPDRRTINIAIIDCNANQFNGQANGIPVAAYGTAFLASPMVPPGTGGETGSFSIEIIDIAGPYGNGSLDNLIRDEAFLVR